MNEKIKRILDTITGYSSFIFPVLLVILSAATIMVALNAAGVKEKRIAQIDAAPLVETSTQQMLEGNSKEISLELNTNPDIEELIQNFIDTRVSGDEEALRKLYDDLDDKDLLRAEILSKYIDHYTGIEIYTKPGCENDDKIIYLYYRMVFKGQEDSEVPGFYALYATRDEAGHYYIKNRDFTDEMNEYLDTVSMEADVVDLSNRIKVEYDDLISENTTLLSFLDTLNTMVGSEIGVRLAQLRAQEESEQPSEESVEIVNETMQSAQMPVQEIAEEEPVVEYVITTESINLRESDSTKAARVGSVEKGTKLKLVEKLVNGWSKVLYKDKEVYASTDYLQDVVPEKEEAVIGSIVAKGSVNIRSGPDVNTEKIGVLPGGESAELFSKADGWCKIKFGNKIGYVKEEYVN